MFKQLPKKGVCLAEKQLQKVVPPKYHHVIPYLVFFLALVIVVIVVIIFKRGGALLWQLKRRLSSEKDPPGFSKGDEIQKTKDGTPSKLSTINPPQLSKDERSHPNYTPLSQIPRPKQNETKHREKSALKPLSPKTRASLGQYAWYYDLGMRELARKSTKAKSSSKWGQT